MNMVNKILKKQKYSYFSTALRGLVLTGLGIYIGIMLLIEGLGTQSGSQKGKAALFTNLMNKLLGDRADAEQIMAYCLAGVMLIVAIVGLYYLFKGASHMLSSRTLLGKSIVLQSKNYEKFSDTVAAINADMARESHTFGKVSIGREWILEAEAMRLSNVKGVFWLDEGESDFVLCCVDDVQNIWASSFLYVDERDQALKYLRSRFPEVTFGDSNAYLAFLKKEMGVSEPEEAEETEEILPLPDKISESTRFRYIKANGIPTSNFTNQEILEAFEALIPGQRIALCPMDGSVEEIFFQKENEALWEVTMCYSYQQEEGRKTVHLGEYEAKDALENLLVFKKLPDFS